MRLTTIGTGTAAPSPARVQSGTLIEAGAVRLLVDCGGGVVFRMAQLGIDWLSITHVALTHFHADHITDLANLIYAWRYGTLPPRQAPAEIIGPPGTAQLLLHLASSFGSGLVDLPPPIAIREVATGEQLDLGEDVRLEAQKVPHTDESMAYSVSTARRRIVVSGDTGFAPTLAEWAEGCDAFVLECSLPDELALPTHLTPRQCGMLAAIAQPRLLALTHFYPPVEATDVAAQVGEQFGGHVVVTSDGWMNEIEET